MNSFPQYLPLKLFVWGVILFCSTIVLAQPCTTEAGTLQAGNVFACQNDTILAIFNEDAVLEANDTLLFVLHDGSQFPIGTTYATSAIPKFTFVVGAMIPNYTYFITAVAADANPFGFDGNDPCLSISNSVEVTFAEQPFAFLAGPDSICIDNIDNLIVTLPQGQFDLVYNDGVSDILLENISNPYLIPVNPQTNTTYSLTEIYSLDNPYCGVLILPGTTDTYLQIEAVGPGPASVDVNFTCTPDYESFVVDFYITSGDPTTYEVLMPGYGGQLIGNHFVSSPIPNTEFYEYFIVDAFNCHPIEVAGAYGCPCISQVGIVNALPDNDGVYCTSETTDVLYDPSNVVSDANDSLLYILHVGSGLPSADGNLLATNDTPQFTFDPTYMVANQVYYISAVLVSVNNAGQLVWDNPCISFSAPVNITFFNPSSVTLTGNGPICEGQVANLNINPVGYGPFNVVISDGTQNISLNNLTGQTTISLTPDDNTTYTLVDLIDAQSPGCYLPLSSELTFVVEPAPDAGLALPLPDICEGAQAEIALANYLNAEDVNGVWQQAPGVILPIGALDPASGVLLLNSLAPNNYAFTYTVAGQNVCPDAVANLLFNYQATPEVNAGPDKQMDCFGTPLSIGSGIVESEFEYQWFFDNVALQGAISSTDTADFPGPYTLVITDVVTGCFNSDTLEVQGGLGQLEPELFVVPIRCNGLNNGAVAVDSLLNAQPPVLYSLNGGDLQTDPYFINLTAGYQTLHIEDAFGCSLDTAIYFLNPAALELTLNFTDTTIIYGQTISLEPVFEGPNPLVSYTWELNDVTFVDDSLFQNYVITPSLTNFVSVSATDSLGCNAKAEATIVVQNPRNVFLPTVFNPLSSNIENTRFSVFADAEVVRIEEMQITDRWGTQYFLGNNLAPNTPSEFWDGTFRGTPAPQGVYAVFLVVRYSDGFRQEIRTDVTVVY